MYTPSFPMFIRLLSLSYKDVCGKSLTTSAVYALGIEDTSLEASLLEMTKEVSREKTSRYVGFGCYLVGT